MDCTQYANGNCTLPHTGIDWLGAAIAIAIMLVVVGIFIRTHTQQP